MHRSDLNVLSISTRFEFEAQDVAIEQLESSTLYPDPPPPESRYNTRNISLSEDDQALACIFSNGVVNVRDTTTGEILQVFRAAFSRDLSLAALAFNKSSSSNRQRTHGRNSTETISLG